LFPTGQGTEQQHIFKDNFLTAKIVVKLTAKRGEANCTKGSLI
jgi:hypothetical protein